MSKKKGKSPVRKANRGKSEDNQSFIIRLIKVIQKRIEELKKAHRFKPLNEFRTNYAEGNHPNYIFGKIGKKYKSLGITHDSTTFGKKNMPLKKNPQKGDSRKAYIRNGIISKNEKYYGKNTLKDFSFSKEDYANVKAKIRDYKKRLKAQEKLKRRREKEKNKQTQ